jgi:hypothetical protein
MEWCGRRPGDFRGGLEHHQEAIMRFIAAILAGLFLAAVGIGTAQAAPSSAVVLPKKATLLADGSVQITMKVRCNRHQQAFEWSVDMRQGTVFGNDSAGPAAGLITCDGHFHKVNAHVVGANGPYQTGRAEVQALVQLFDADEGSDVELEDRAVVRLRP